MSTYTKDGKLDNRVQQGTFPKYYDTREIQNYKTRLVVKDFLQTYRKDYDEAFVPVVSHTNIRLFLAAAAYHKLTR